VCGITKHHNASILHVVCANVRDLMRTCSGGEEEDSEVELPCDPVGHGKIATESFSSCSPFCKTFVRCAVVIQWIEDGYHLPRAVEAPLSKEMENFYSALEHQECVSNPVAEMGAENAVTLLLLGREAYDWEPP